MTARAGSGDDNSPFLPCAAFEGLDAASENRATTRISHAKFTVVVEWMRANDPSAGSPTETLLRLLLPLSDKVH